MSLDHLDTAPGLSCTCSCEAFERVIVERILGHRIVTDLVSCIECKVVYYVPLPPPVPVVLLSGHGMGTMVLPKAEGDSGEQLKRDAAEAAKAYRKPGRSGRLGPGGRR